MSESFIQGFKVGWWGGRGGGERRKVNELIEKRENVLTDAR